MISQVHVVDYGIGNIFNLVRALKHTGFEVIICQSPDQLAHAECIILPGVGAFQDCMLELTTRRFDVMLQNHVAKGGILMGVCVGMHLLADMSEEFGIHSGLGFISGAVKKISANPKKHIKLPHVAWRQLHFNVSEVKFPINDAGYYYFIHSFSFQCDDLKNEIAYCCNQDIRISAIIAKGNVYGFQFHPEKSGVTGLKFLQDVIHFSLKRKRRLLV